MRWPRTHSPSEISGQLKPRRRFPDFNGTAVRGRKVVCVRRKKQFPTQPALHDFISMSYLCARVFLLYKTDVTVLRLIALCCYSIAANALFLYSHLFAAKKMVRRASYELFAGPSRLRRRKMYTRSCCATAVHLVGRHLRTHKSEAKRRTMGCKEPRSACEFCKVMRKLN